MIEGFKERFEAFIKEWDRVGEECYGKFVSLPYKPLEFKINRKWAKVFQDGSVKAFVNTENGDIMKPASWKAPAKHARGNIFSKEIGMEAITKHSICSVRYMR